MFVNEHEEIVIDFTDKKNTIRSGYEQDCMYTYLID